MNRLSDNMASADDAAITAAANSLRALVALS